MILLLNADYTPLNTINLKRATKMLYKGKVEVVAEDSNVQIYKDFFLPTVVRLIRYISAPYKKILLSRENVFKRDNGICAYCGGTKHLTVDHIIPKSRGGANSWENLITSCFSCNNRKDNRTPQEAGMKLQFKPYKPNYFSFMTKNIMKEDWKAYVFH